MALRKHDACIHRPDERLPLICPSCKTMMDRLWDIDDDNEAFYCARCGILKRPCD